MITAVPASPKIEFDTEYPWLFTVAGSVDDEAIGAELYGDVTVPTPHTTVIKWRGLVPETVDRRVAYPELLRAVHQVDYQLAMRARQAELHAQMRADVERIRAMPLTKFFGRLKSEQSVLDILTRWAHETYPARVGFLDQFFAMLSGIVFDVGVLTTQYTNLYSYILNHFSRADEVRKLRDEYCTLYRGDEGTAELSFLGTLWDDVKSGAVASRIGNFGVGLLESAFGLVKGLGHFIAHPIETLLSLGNLPRNLAALWHGRGKLWRDFVNSSPDEQARTIGRLTGDVEQLIAVAQVGGAAAGAAPAAETATATEIVGMSGRAAVLGGRAGAATMDLGLLGTEGARSLAVLAEATRGASGAQSTAEDLGQKPASSSPTDTGSAEPRTAEAPEREPAPAEAPSKPSPLTKAEFDKLAWADRNAYITRYMQENGIKRLVKVNDHHAWPKYLGGPENGPLIPLDEQLHRLFHAKLDLELERRLGTAHFSTLSEAQRAANIRILKAVARDFDIEFKSSISKVLARALKGTPYE